MNEGDDADEIPGMEVFPENNERVQAQKKRDIRVIIGNPPYSAKQESANDDNPNLKYPELDKRVADTYAAGSAAANKGSLYDSYIKAVRWASDRIGNEGVVCFTTNGGFLDGSAADGLRRSLVDEFSKIIVFNLRGNARTSGEDRRKEADNIFGSGSRASIAITLLVKDPKAKQQGQLLYHDIGDYLSREEKLAMIRDAGTMGTLEVTAITPNDAGDWINQRSEEFTEFAPIGTKDKAEVDSPIFANHSRGLETTRDAWTYNFSVPQLVDQIKSTIEFYNDQVAKLAASPPSKGIPEVDLDATKFSWNADSRRDLRNGKKYESRTGAVRAATYRPFMRLNVYFDKDLNSRQGQMPAMFPTGTEANFGLSLSGIGSAGFAVLAVGATPDVNMFTPTQFFPRYTFAPPAEEGSLFSEGAADEQGRIDNITDATLQRFQSQFGETVTKDAIFFYVYGLLHSPEYRSRFAADLQKMLPRIPMVENWSKFADAGRKFSELHLGYEEVEPYPLTINAPSNPSYRVEKMRFAKNGKEKDRSTIIYNSQITVSDIPEEAYRYMLGARSAVEWIIDRYRLTKDTASGIVNDPNDWADEHGEPRYILDLLGRVVTVSVETMKIVDALPKLEIIED
jgi:predicted helicase